MEKWKKKGEKKRRMLEKNEDNRRREVGEKEGTPIDHK